MIKINDKLYEIYDVKTVWENLTINQNGKTESRKSPFITFNVGNGITIELEFTLSQTTLFHTKVNQEMNIKDYLSDITMENGKGWDSLILGKYDASVTRLNEKTFYLDFYVEKDEESVRIHTNVDFFE